MTRLWYYQNLSAKPSNLSVSSSSHRPLTSTCSTCSSNVSSGYASEPDNPKQGSGMNKTLREIPEESEELIADAECQEDYHVVHFPPKTTSNLIHADVH